MTFGFNIMSAEKKMVDLIIIIANFGQWSVT